MAKSSMSIEIIGAQEVARKLASISNKAKAEVNRALTNAGLLVERNVKVRTPPMAKASPKPRTNFVRTGRLVGSIHTQPARNFVCYVGTNVEYGPHVECGTKYFKGRKMFQKGLADSKSQVKRIVSDGMSRAIKKI